MCEAETQASENSFILSKLYKFRDVYLMSLKIGGNGMEKEEKSMGWEIARDLEAEKKTIYMSFGYIK